MNKLHYHKCDDCLTAFTTVEDHVDYCDCGGEISYMGEVQGSHYLVEKDKTPCDGRCTHACGPVCDCVCGGVNHGTGKILKVKEVGGKIHTTNLSPEDIERAVKYRTVRDYAQKMVDSIIESWARHSGQRTLNHIIKLRRYEPRMQALYDFIIKNKK